MLFWEHRENLKKFFGTENLLLNSQYPYLESDLSELNMYIVNC